MDRLAWTHQYKRLLTAFGKKANPEQSAVYFTALSHFVGASVHDAVTQAIKDAKFWPTPAELVERARTAQHAHRVPATACDVCHGSTWEQFRCDGVTSTKEGPRVTNHAQFCGVGDAPHQDHGYASRCRQCWVSLERTA